MLRILLTIVLPILLPFVIFALYLVYARRRAVAGGEAPPGWSTAPWPWLCLAGLVLVILALLLLLNSRSVEPGVKLVPPHVEDGRIVPSAPKE